MYYKQLQNISSVRDTYYLLFIPSKTNPLE